MPQFEFTFTDQSTLGVNAPDAAAALQHVNKLLQRAEALDDPKGEYYGKKLASTTPKQTK